MFRGETWYRKGCLKEEVVLGIESEMGYGWASVHAGLSR